MGICISIASSEIHGAPKEVHHENVITFEASKVLNSNQGLCSVYSKQGTKGLNQDAASIHQVGLFVCNGQPSFKFHSHFSVTMSLFGFRKPSLVSFLVLLLSLQNLENRK